jgi:hypothetical protein
LITYNITIYFFSREKARMGCFFSNAPPKPHRKSLNRLKRLKNAVFDPCEPSEMGVKIGKKPVTKPAATKPATQKTPTFFRRGGDDVYIFIP